MVRAGAGDEAPQPAQLGRELVDRVAGTVGQVEATDHGAPSVRADALGRLVGAGLVRVPGDADVVAGGRERDRGRAADAGVGAGDDDASGS